MNKKEIVELIMDAGNNQISMIDPTEVNSCGVCHRGFTGTYWISMNDLIFQITGKHLSDYDYKFTPNGS